MPIGRRLSALVVVAMTAPAWGQTPANQAGPAFAVASVRPSPPADDLVMPVPGVAYPGGRWRASRIGVRLLVMKAYGVRMEQVVGLPSSMAGELFDIDARAASPDATEAEMLLMLRHLLADRFRLRLHFEQRPVEMVALVLARDDSRLGPGLRPAASGCANPGEAPGRADAALPPCMDGRTAGGVQQWRLRNQMLSSIVQVTAAAAVLGGSVVDRTGLTGTFDIDLDYVPGWLLLGDDPPHGATLVTAFEEQLGLKFERVEEPMDVIVIDHVEPPEPN